MAIALGGVVFGWFVVVGIHAVAESSLKDAQDTRADLTGQVASFDYVGVAKLQHETAMSAQAWAGATDVKWDDYLAAISAVVPEGVVLTQISMTQATPQTGFNLSSGTPFQQPDLGQLSFTGSAKSPQLVADLMTALSAVSGVAEVSYGSSRIEQVVDSDQPMWAFDVSARVTLNALSGRTVVPVESTDGASASADAESGAGE